jgi:hypothetical protein
VKEEEEEKYNEGRTIKKTMVIMKQKKNKNHNRWRIRITYKGR